MSVTHFSASSTAQFVPTPRWPARDRLGGGFWGFLPCMARATELTEKLREHDAAQSANANDRNTCLRVTPR